MRQILSQASGIDRYLSLPVLLSDGIMPSCLDTWSVLVNCFMALVPVWFNTET